VLGTWGTCKSAQPTSQHWASIDIYQFYAVCWLFSCTSVAVWPDHYNQHAHRPVAEWCSQKCKLRGLASIPFPPLLSPPLPFPLFSPLLSPYPSPLPFSFFTSSFPLPKSRTPKIQLGDLGNAVSTMVESGTKPQPKSNLVHCSFKI